MDRVMTRLSFVFCNEMKHGQLGVIPGSMGTRGYTVSGLENDMAFHSALHGASRRLSCGDAKRRFTMKDFEQQMKGDEGAMGAGIWVEIALPWGVLAHHEYNRPCGTRSGNSLHIRLRAMCVFGRMSQVLTGLAP